MTASTEPTGVDPSAMDRISALPDYVPGVEWLAVPIKYVPALTMIYVSKLETGKTTDNCICLWIIHPEDTEKPPEGQRKRRSNQHPLCPVHTKEGLISGFLEFVYKNPNVCLACPWDCVSCSKDETDCECYEHTHPDDAIPEGIVPSEDEFKCLHLDTRKGDVCQKCGVTVKRRDGND